MQLDSSPQVLAKVERQLQEQLSDVQGAVCLGVSALTGEGVEQVLPAILQAFSVWNQRVNTSSLNKWLIRVSCNTLLSHRLSGRRLLYFASLGATP